MFEPPRGKHVIHDARAVSRKPRILLIEMDSLRVKLATFVESRLFPN